MSEGERTTSPDTAGAEPASAAERWEDYVDVFTSPAELFRRRAGSGLTHPIVTLVVASLVLYFVMLPANRSLFAQNLPADPQAAAFMERYGLILQIGIGFLAPVSVMVAVLFAAFLLWLACSMLGVRLTFRNTVLIATFAGFIGLLQQAVAGLLVSLREGPIDPVRDLSFGVLRLTGGDDVPRALVPLLGRLDVFTIWQAVVWAVGVRVIGNATRAHATIAAGAAWLLFAVPRMLLSALPQPTPPPRAPG